MCHSSKLRQTSQSERVVFGCDLVNKEFANEGDLLKNVPSDTRHTIEEEDGEDASREAECAGKHTTVPKVSLRAVPKACRMGPEPLGRGVDVQSGEFGHVPAVEIETGLVPMEQLSQLLSKTPNASILLLTEDQTCS